jgi:hypothetical protein
MKTAMQELWDYIDANYHEKGFNLYNAKEISLEKEKEQIRNAYNNGYFAAYKYKDWEEYYKQAYNQDRITISETKRSIEGIGLPNQNK